MVLDSDQVYAALAAQVQKLGPLLQTVSVVMTTLSAVAASFAAVATWKQSARILAAHEATVLLSMNQRYNAPEMRDALHLLIGSFAEAPAGFADRWQQDYLAGDEEAAKVNAARRLLSGYFIDVARLARGRAISNVLARELMARNGLNIFYEICEPLNNAHNPQRSMDYVAYLRRIRRAYGRRARAKG